MATPNPTFGDDDKDALVSVDYVHKLKVNLIKNTIF